MPLHYLNITTTCYVNKPALDEHKHTNAHLSAYGMLMRDSPKASSRATVFLSEVLAHQQVIPAAGPGAVAADRRPAAEGRSVVHPGGDPQWRVLVHMKQSSSVRGTL